MATPDPTNVLFKIAHPDLYARNPFNLLNLPIDATAKAIRRRREDIEAAFEAGTEAEEFRHVLPLDDQRKPPTLEAVHEAFDAINDPELRIAYSLFWFWNASSNHKRDAKDPNGQVTASNIAVWRNLSEGAEGANSESRVVACHNLSVFAHLQALARDGLVISLQRHDALTDYSSASDRFWREAIRYWNMIAASPENWRYVGEHVTALEDPRLDYCFARSLRDQFAFAFDQINVELAIDFAKAGREADAKRQVEYMKLSQPDADDVEGTFDDAFAGLQKQVEAIVNAAREEANKNPKVGLAKVDEILERTKVPVQISRIVFDKGAPIRESIIKTIFSGVRCCMIAYGNSTTDWDGCLKRIDALNMLAENDRQKALVAEDERIITENKMAKDEEETCPVCKRHYSTVVARKTISVNIYGNLKKGGRFGQVEYSRNIVTLEMCSKCASWIHLRHFDDHPVIKKLLAIGWKVGYEPTETDLRILWGLSQGTSPPPLEQKSTPMRRLRKHMQHHKPHEWILFVFIVVFVVAINLMAMHGASTSSSSISSSRQHQSSYHSSHVVKKEDEDSSIWESRRRTPPHSGTVRWHRYGVADSPLKITTSYGSDYFVKIFDLHSKTTILDIFISGGRSEEIDIPSGTYEIRYASGKKWYGYQYLFGPKTIYSKADRFFSFSDGSGYELTLYKIANGNLKTKALSPEEF